MSMLLQPATELELADIIVSGTGFAVQGLGSKMGLGRALADKPTLSMRAFSGVDVYEPEELVLEAGAATPLPEVEALLAKRQQMLAFEPPHLEWLYGATSQSSLGGILACGLAGPRRLKVGSARDHVLGVRGVTGRGEIFKAGARVVKNVTGYDMPKLMASSFGTLAALTTITFKVLPQPEFSQTLLKRGLNDAAALGLMRQVLQSSADVSGAAHVPGVGTFLRLEGIAASVAARRDKLLAHIKTCEVLEADEASPWWHKIRDCRILAAEPQTALWRISVAPDKGAEVIEKIRQQLNGTYFFDWGGGLIWMRVSAAGDAGANIIRSCLSGGHATLFAAPASVRSAVGVFQPQAPALAALTRRLKLAFDPTAKLNPGLMYEGL